MCVDIIFCCWVWELCGKESDGTSSQCMPSAAESCLGHTGTVEYAPIQWQNTGSELLLFAVWILRVLYEPLTAQGYISCPVHIFCLTLIHELIQFFRNPLYKYNMPDILPFTLCLETFLKDFVLFDIYIVSLYVFVFANWHLFTEQDASILTSTCSDWFQKMGQGLPYRHF